MFAQESVMGIKKEREAFERLPLAELAIESEFVFYNEETNSYWPNEDFCPSDAPETMNFAWEAWQAAKAHEAEKLKGCVLVPVQCPDPDFADSLFDELSKKAIGEFGDDLLIHFSDIDEEKIWALMVEAAKARAVPEGFVEKTESNTHHYFKLKDWDEWTCIDGIKDAITSDHDINAIVEVECLEVIEINNKPCFALLAFGKRHGTEVKFFDTEEEAIEAQEPTND